MIARLLCLLGLHDDWTVIDKRVLQAYIQCARCSRIRRFI